MKPEELIVVGVELNRRTPLSVDLATEPFEDQIKESIENLRFENSLKLVYVRKSVQRTASVPFPDHTLGLLPIQELQAWNLPFRHVRIRPLQPALRIGEHFNRILRQLHELSRCPRCVEESKNALVGFRIDI